MKASEIQKGGVYAAKVSGNLTHVRVDEIRLVTQTVRAPSTYGARAKYRDKTFYDCTNLKTGRKVTFKSAMKFRRVIAQTSTKIHDAVAIEVPAAELPGMMKELGL